MLPRYPIYIISKGRAKSPRTAKALDKMQVPFKIVIEPQELKEYSETIDKDKILVLPFENLGKGSIPARNWVWEHSIKAGFERHWILDDNISSFCRYNNNKRTPVKSPAIFCCSEDFVDRYENIGLAGFQYRFFATHCRLRPAFIANTRIYSCILIKNDIPFKWRGKYNEDTDLALRVLKEGYSTILFVAFLQDKAGTMTTSGGNTEELYQGEGRLEMAQSLVNQHPDIVSITHKWGRPQHLVDYKKFKKNKLIKKPGITIPKGVNNYGMVLKEKGEN